MTSAERVKLSRWVNGVEAKADELLEMLKNGPTPLPRNPVIDPDLLDRLAAFTIGQDRSDESDYPSKRFLTLGNGNQSRNRKRALACTGRLIEGAKVIDRRTIDLPNWGRCSFSAYTHPKGAMISTPNRDDNNYGDADWHRHGQVAMFRDIGDGRCILYISDLEPLFKLRSIGHHGVTWENVAKTAKQKLVFSASDALEAEAKA